MADKADFRVMVSIPTAGTVPSAFAYSLAGMVARFAAERVPTVPEASLSMIMRVVESSNWITNREKLAKMALDEDVTHILTLDDDMTFDPRVLEILLGRRQDIVLTNYLIKTHPPKDFVAVDLKGRRLPTTAQSTGIQPIQYSGFGVGLIKADVFRKVPRPWFMPKYNEENYEYTTEDFPFFEKVREAGYTVYVDHDASKLVGHIGRKTWVWDEVKHDEVKNG
jgi:hypothetical protein